MKKIILIIIAVLLLGTVALTFIRKNVTSEINYEFGEVTTGNLENLVSSTGTLNTIGAVEVGTQLSGIVEKVLVDYNDNVKKGDVLAILDTLELGINYRTNQSDLNKAQAQYQLSKKIYSDNKQLYEQNYISELDYITSSTNLQVSKSSVVNAQANLEKARIRLENYAIIRSPIDGKVIDCSIEAGQTVAASLSSPVLFLIAENLEQMEIEAYVDESDIGMIQAGQTARFTVEAYSDKSFEGIVKQIRLQPKTVSNVVNYTVIVSTNNPESILLPGMTATIDFVVEQKLDVTLVPATALKFNPSEEQMKKAFEKMRSKHQRPPERGAKGERPNMRRDMSNVGRIWYLDDADGLSMAVVKLGSTDGINTEITTLGGEITNIKPIIKQTTKTSKESSSDPKPRMRLPGMGRM